MLLSEVSDKEHPIWCKTWPKLRGIACCRPPLNMTRNAVSLCACAASSHRPCAILQITNCVKWTTGKPIMWGETDGSGGPSFSDTWVLRMAEKWPRWQADKLMIMGLALSAVLNRDFCGFGVVHISRSQFHTSFCSPTRPRDIISKFTNVNENS